MKMPCPCRDCPVHSADCHAKCRSYLEWQAGVIKEREERNQKAYASWQLRSAVHEKWLKWRRDHK